MSFINTNGRSARVLTRAQNWATNIEFAPRSSKKVVVDRNLLEANHFGEQLSEETLSAAWRGGVSALGR